MLLFQVLWALITPQVHKQRSRQWTGFRLAWSGSRYSWRGQRMQTGRTEATPDSRRLGLKAYKGTHAPRPFSKNLILHLHLHNSWESLSACITKDFGVFYIKNPTAIHLIKGMISTSPAAAAPRNGKEGQGSLYPAAPLKNILVHPRNDK